MLCTYHDPAEHVRIEVAVVRRLPAGLLGLCGDLHRMRAYGQDRVRVLSRQGLYDAHYPSEACPHQTESDDAPAPASAWRSQAGSSNGLPPTFLPSTVSLIKCLSAIHTPGTTGVSFA